MADHPLHQNMALQATHPHTDPLDLDDLDTITRTLDPIQDKISICPTRKLSIWRAVLKERYVPSVPNNQKLQCTWRDQNKQRKPISTDVNDTLDDCYNDVPDDLLVFIVQISAGKSKLLTLTLYYTTGTIMLPGRACRKWGDQEFSDTDSPSTPSTSCGCRL